MEIIIKGPGKYVQEAGIIDKLGEYAAELGNHMLILCSANTRKRIGNRIESSLTKAGCTAVFDTFCGETTQDEIDRVVKDLADYECDVIVGAGGGKVIDAARGAADACGVKLVVLPTVASNDSPCSALSVIHDEAGKVLELRVTKRSPELVLVDTEIIAAAPVRLLIAGIGDALATWFEARACKKSGAVTTSGGRCSDAALALAKLCYDTLVQHGPSAMEAVSRGEINESLEKVVHANTYLSGIGFESGGVAAAHAINDGFSIIPEGNKLYHGEVVGFGVLCLLVLENASEAEIFEVTSLMKTVGLPMTLEQMNMSHLDDDTLHRVAEAACATPVMPNMPFKVTAEDAFNAIKKADEIGRNALK